MLPATVSNICVGKTTSPKADFFEALATHYPSLNLRWLLLGEGSMEIDRPAAPSPDEENRRIILQLSESVTRLSAQGEQLIEDTFSETEQKKRVGPLVDFYKDERPYNEALRSLSAWVGIEKHLTSHVGRHTFATNYLLAGGKVERLSRMLGHSDLQTTMIYVHLVEDYLDADMEGLAEFFNA